MVRTDQIESLSRARRAVAVVLGATAAVLLVAQPAGAHVGLPAGGAVDGLTHPIFGLDHLLAMVAVGVVAAMVGDRRVAWLTPVGFVCGMVLGGVLGLAGLQVPAVELVIAASVVALGLLVITRLGTEGLWLPVLAAAFGAAHGHAHGAELPDGAIAVAYLLGFVASTVALHVAGAGLGSALRRLPSVRVAAGAATSTVGVLLLLGA